MTHSKDGKITDRLLYRRQFLIAEEKIAVPESWHVVGFDNLFVHVHPDLPLAQAESGRLKIAVLGEILNPLHPEMGNQDITNSLAGDGSEIESALRELRELSGRYVVLMRDSRRTVLMHDALGLREVYYTTAGSVVLAGSQPNLLAEFGGGIIQERTGGIVEDFRSGHYRDRKWIGEYTSYLHVRHLLPNHLLVLSSRTAERYWPVSSIERVDLDESVERSARILRGAIEGLANRHPLMMAVTAGTDSRSLLAAARPFVEKIHFFINDHGLGPAHPDIWVPTEMMRSLRVPFHVHPVDGTVERHFEETFYRNVEQATGKLLPTIYNVYYRRLQGRVNVLGIGEIGRTRYGPKPDGLDAHRLAYALGYPMSAYVRQVCASFLRREVPLCDSLGINPMTLLYWEQMLGNWGAVGNAESDIAIEEVNPFACHRLYETFLGVDPIYCKYSRAVLFDQIIEHLWPGLSRWPINPPKGPKQRLIKCLKGAGVYGIVKEAKYRVSKLRDRINA